MDHGQNLDFDFDAKCFSSYIYFRFCQFPHQCPLQMQSLYIQSGSTFSTLFFSHSGPVSSPYFHNASTCREYGLTLSTVSPVCVHLVVFMTRCRLLSLRRDVVGVHGLASAYLSFDHLLERVSALESTPVNHFLLCISKCVMGVISICRLCNYSISHSISPLVSLFTNDS